jgi:hypothetical protein
MKFLIGHGCIIGEDTLIIEGDTIEEIQKKAHEEISKRGWKVEDCFSIPVGKDITADD